MPGEESDESARETSSDGSSDYETERGAFCVGAWNQPDMVEPTVQGMKGLTLRSKPFNGSSSDEGEVSSSPGVLTFEYFEHNPPYSREPLADKASITA
ncbi:Ribosome biogenesis ATPase RIX7 [Bienertia sinuspersici]